MQAHLARVKCQQEAWEHALWVPTFQITVTVLQFRLYCIVSLRLDAAVSCYLAAELLVLTLGTGALQKGCGAHSLAAVELGLLGLHP